MDRFDIRIQCLKIALNERYKDVTALRERTDVFYDIVTNGEEPPAHAPTVQIFNGGEGVASGPVPVGPLAAGKSSGNPTSGEGAKPKSK